MAILIDAFTDTDGVALTSHTPSNGGSWTEHASLTSGNWQHQSNRVRCASGDSMVYYSADPDSADYFVEFDVFWQTGFTGGLLELSARHSTTEYTGYGAGHQTSGTDRYVINEYANSTTPTELTSTAEGNPANGTTQVFKFELIGTALKLYIDGVEKLSATDGTITGAGKYGMRGPSTGSAAGSRIDDYEYEDLGGGGGGTPQDANALFFGASF